MSDETKNAGELLTRLGADAAKWAAEFRKMALRLGYSDMDEGWLIGWFANAIEHSHTLRVGSVDKATLAALRAGTHVVVPREIIDRFPEINPSNYGHDEACALNDWGVELVLVAAPEPGHD